MTSSKPNEIEPGAKVRVTMPNWNGPGVVVYTVEVVLDNDAIIRQPKVPGLKGETRSVKLAQIVLA